MKNSIIWLTLLVSIYFTASCIKLPDLETDKKTDPTVEPEPTDTKEKAKTINELEITSFGILPAHNERIYIPINFIEKENSTYTFEGNKEIKYYKADLTALKASFTSNASEVTIGASQQTSKVTVNNFTEQLTYRFYALDGNYKEYTVSVKNPADSYSGLPLLVLTVNDGSAITAKEIWKAGKVRIDNQNLTNVSNYVGMSNIRGRGNHTWSLPKKPYALQLENKDPLVGMSKQKRWAVLANYGDKTLLRNRLSFEIAKRTSLAWTPNSQYVEVIINGTFQGNYLLTEQIRRDKNRVNIKETDNTATGEDITGGYLIELDRFNYNDPNCIHLTKSDLPIIIKDPEPMNSAQKAYITDYLNNIESKLYKENPDTLEYHQLIDITSFIDYWIVYEIAGNRDILHPGSSYMHKDVNGKIVAGPIWDFDLATYIGTNSLILVNHDILPGSYDYETNKYRALWYNKLFKDPKFKAKAKERWTQLYNGGAGVLSTIPNFIEQEAAYIQKSARINWQPTGIWAPDYNPEKATTGTNRDDELEWSVSVQKLITNYSNRLVKLDKLIADM